MSHQPNGQLPHFQVAQPHFPGTDEMFVPRLVLPVSGKRCCFSLSLLECGKWKNAL